jgi:hypothetical protein
MPHGAEKPVANRVSFALTPLETGGGGDWTLISKGTAGADGGGGGGGGGGGDAGVGDGPFDGAGEDVGEGEGDAEGDGLGDEVGAATAASSSLPPHATRPLPVATESESVKKSALRLMGWRARGTRFEAA